MKKETFLYSILPPASPESVEDMRQREWKVLLRGAERLRADKHQKYYERLRRSAANMLEILIDNVPASDRVKTVVHNFEVGGNEHRELKTFQIINPGMPLGDTHFHLLGYDSKDEGQLAYEMFITSGQFLRGIGRPKESANPNYNRQDKVLGVWVGEDYELSGAMDRDTRVPMASIYDAHETLVHLFDLAEIDMPDGFYHRYAKVMHRSRRDR